MKKYIGLLIVSIFAGLVFWSCSDDSATSPTNKAPTCTITAPATNIVIDEGSVIDVSVTAQDADGEIEKVYFYLNTTIIDSASSSPYNAAIPTLALGIGEFYIIAYAKDDDGAESYPDSISFSNTPKAPSNFNISQVDISTANLTWHDNSFSEEKFVIERKLSTESEYQIISEITGNDVSTKIYADINLEPALSYDYRIKTVKGTSESIYINQSYNNVFSPPSDLTIIQNNVYTFTLNWADNSIGEDGFKVERKIDDGTFTVIATVTGNSYVDNTVLKKGYGTVYYQVRAYKGTTYYSTFATANSAVLFPAPTSLIYTKENINTIKLAWTDNSTGEEGFKIDKKVGVSDWVVRIGSVSQNIQTWSDTNADINENLTYRVYAYKGSNSTSSISTSIIYNTFPAPTELAVLQTSVTSANLEWSDNSIGEEKFEIERKLSTESNYLKIGEVTGSDTTNKTWIDSNLTPNEVYDYRIKAVFGQNYSQYTIFYEYFNEFCGPTGLSITQNSLTSATIIWTDNSIGEVKFEIERKLDIDTEYLKIGEVNSIDSLVYSFFDSNIVPCSIFNYRIKATLGEFSSNYTYIDYNNTIPAPSNVILSRISTSSSIIRVVWDDNSTGEEGFLIERKDTNTDAWLDLITVNQNEEMWIDSTSISGITSYRIKTMYQSFQSDYSAQVSIEIIPKNMIKVSSGTFSMGSITGYSNEEPVHSVEITKEYYLGKYEVTQDEWTKIMGSNPSAVYGVGTTYPVYNLNWYSAVKYCNLRSNAENLTPCYSINGTSDTNLWGDIPSTINSDWDSVICDFFVNGYRLPTEAEWEYSARYNDGRNYPWGDYWPNVGICNFNNAQGHATPVGFYPEGNSQLEFCDMAGNLAEWVWDWYGEYLETSQTDPTGPSSIQSGRVYRGGHWIDGIDGVRSTYRPHSPPNLLHYAIGFRIARSR